MVDDIWNLLLLAQLVMSLSHLNGAGRRGVVIGKFRRNLCKAMQFGKAGCWVGEGRCERVQKWLINDLFPIRVLARSQKKNHAAGIEIIEGLQIQRNNITNLIKMN